MISSSSNKYYIVRHGETFASLNSVPYGDQQETAEILPEGVPAIKRLAEYLKTVPTDINYTSRFLRCLQTSQAINQITGKEFEKHKLLGEYVEPTFDEFKERMQTLVTELEQAEKTTYLLCTHGGIISALKHLLIFGEYEESDLMDYPVPGTLMIISSSGSEVINFNQ